jgi:hypothetical protein
MSIKNIIIRPEEKINVSLWLDDYDGFFSDFDPRSYSQRALSDDFLTEVKKVVHEYKPGLFDITFLIPLGKRENTTEEIIKGRLHSYFKKKEHLLEIEYKNSIRKGVGWVITAFICLICAAYISYLQPKAFPLHIIRVILEPAGWFLAWSGMDNMISASRNNKYEMDFSKKMARAEIRFDAYSAH